MKTITTLLTLILLLGSQGIGYCELVDEGGTGQAVAADDIPNRPMRDDANLKAIQVAFDDSDPRANIKRFPYDPGVTYKIRLREFMGCAVILPEGEKIASYTLFDKHIFSFTPLSDKNPVLTNIFNIYARYHGADTNLVVHGESGNIYSFYIRVDSVDSAFMPNLVTYIDDPATTMAIKQKARAKKEAEKLALAQAEKEEAKKPKQENPGNDYLSSLPLKVAPEDINLAYDLKGGNKDIKPIRVFDDGYFTFFQFSKEKNMNDVKKLPTIYRVVDGYDVPVTTRTSGGCLVAETTNDKWTLRSGGTHFCVWKDD